MANQTPIGNGWGTVNQSGGFPGGSTGGNMYQPKPYASFNQPTSDVANGGNMAAPYLPPNLPQTPALPTGAFPGGGAGGNMPDPAKVPSFGQPTGLGGPGGNMPAPYVPPSSYQPPNFPGGGGPGGNMPSSYGVPIPARPAYGAPAQGTPYIQPTTQPTAGTPGVYQQPPTIGDLMRRRGAADVTGGWGNMHRYGLGR